MFLKFDRKNNKNTYYFLRSCWFKVKKKIKLTRFQNVDSLWSCIVQKKVKKKKFLVKLKKNYITKFLIKQVTNNLIYMEYLKFLLKFQFKQFLVKSFKINNYKMYIYYLQIFWKLVLKKVSILNFVRIKSFKKMSCKLKKSTFFKMVIKNYLIKIFLSLNFSKSIKIKKLYSKYFFLIKKNNQKLIRKNLFYKLYYFKFNNFITIINRKNLNMNNNYIFFTFKQHFFISKLIMKKNYLLNFNSNLFLTNSIFIKTTSINILNFYLKKFKYVNLTFKFLNKLKKQIKQVEKLKLTSFIKKMYKLKNNLIFLSSFFYNLQNLILKIKQFFKIIYIILLNKNIKYRIIKKKINLSY